MFLWLGKNAVPALVNDAFGLNSYEEVRTGKVYFAFLYILVLADAFAFHRPHCLSLRTPSLSALMPSSERFVKCEDQSTGRICT